MAAVVFLCPCGWSAPAPQAITPEELLKQAEETWKKGNRAEAIAICTQVILADAKNRNALALRGRYRAETRQDTKAVEDFDALLKLDPRAAGIYQLRGWSHFRLGHFKEAVADFDRVIELLPAQAPHHWQRGIALYYARRFEDGRKQFELHQTVNPRDVENAVWHFLCVARQSGLEKARAALIPIEGDTRVPMAQVYTLFSGKAKPEDVLAAATKDGPTTGRMDQRSFYAHLYLALYFDVTGARLKAREQIAKATEFKSDDPMADVARVHAGVLSKEKP